MALKQTLRLNSYTSSANSIGFMGDSSLIDARISLYFLLGEDAPYNF
jgi:hypothetical protein